MAKTSSFGFTNTTESTVDVTPIALGLVTNYAVTGDSANQADLSNKTAPIDAQELISFMSRMIPTVQTDLNIQNPAPVKKGIQYTIRVEDTLVTTDSDDASFRVDEPIVASLSIRHPRSGNITGSVIAQVVTRLLSACKTDAGVWRFDDLMRSAERPVAD